MGLAQEGVPRLGRGTGLGGLPEAATEAAPGILLQTYFLPVIGLVDAEKLKPGDLVVSGVPEPRRAFSSQVSPTAEPSPLAPAQVTVGPERLQSCLPFDSCVAQSCGSPFTLDTCPPVT